MSLAIEKEAEVTFDFDYETLAKGLYDEANLGMNQFIKIREFLTKGADLF